MGCIASFSDTPAVNQTRKSLDVEQHITNSLSFMDAINSGYSQPTDGTYRPTQSPQADSTTGWLPVLHLYEFRDTAPASQASVADQQTIARNRVLSDARNKLSGNDLQQFQANMSAFEQRASQKHLAPDTVAQVYAQVAQLFEKPAKVEHPERIAQSIMQYAANPSRIDQGLHPTCAIDALEKETFAHKPALAASMIASVALTGVWTSTDGKTIDVGKFPDNLKPGDEESGWPTKDGDRSMASQLFQATALNDIGLHLNPPRYYDEGRPFPGIMNTVVAYVLPFMSSERWRNADGSDDGTFDGTDLTWLNDETKRLLGTADVLVTDTKNDGVQVTSADELRRTIQNAASNNQMPLAVGLNAEDPEISYGPNHLPYFLNWIIGRIQDPFGNENHVLTIDDYDAASDSVMVHNNWGSQNDHRLAVSDLYRAISGA
jgi:hypothetical protein